MAHRLELAIKDALKESFFKSVDEMLLRIFYLYQKSPKKLRELKDIYELMKDGFEFDDAGVRPIKAAGTRWIAHKTSAMSRIIDKFGLYISHLENVASDTSYRATERARIKGFLKNWKTAKMLVNLCFYQDILEPIKRLSLCLQREGIDTVTAAEAMIKVKKQIDRLKCKNVSEYPNIKVLLSQVQRGEDNTFEYKTVTLRNLDTEIEALDRKKSRELDAVTASITTRLENNNSEFFVAISQILNCEGWERYQINDGQKIEDLEFADEHISSLYNRFLVPLQNSGMTCTESNLHDEWHDLVAYTLSYLNPSTNHYLKTWRRIFDSSKCKRDFTNISLLIEIACQSLPLSWREVSLC